MLQCRAFVLFIFLLEVLIATDSFSQSFSMRGKVTWTSGTPAIGMEVQLQQKQNRQVLASTYTNDKGLYAFFDINAPPHEFLIVISDRNRVLQQETLSGSGANSVIPDIIIE